MTAAAALPITATGIKGFLKWLQREQPAVYVRAAPQIAKLVPQAFSRFGRLGTYRTSRSIVLASERRLQRMGSLGQDTTLQPIDLSATTDMSVPTVDVADAANSGPTSSGTASMIANIVNGISSLYLTKQQSDLNSQIVSAQIANAAAGRPPLNVSPGAYGIPAITAGTSSSTTWLLVGGGLLVVAALFARKRS